MLSSVQSSTWDLRRLNGVLPDCLNSLQDEDGYMAVDALVAVTILAATVVFALAASHQGLRASRAGLEARQANDLIRYIAENSRETSGVVDGATPLFTWRLAVDDAVPSAAAESLCRHIITVTSRRTARSYVAGTDEICPTPTVS